MVAAHRPPPFLRLEWETKSLGKELASLSPRRTRFGVGRSKWRQLLRRGMWIGVSVVAIAVALAGLATGMLSDQLFRWGEFFHIFPRLIVMIFAMVAISAGIGGAASKWWWARQWLIAAAVVHVPVLVAAVTWPDWLDDPRQYLLRAQILLALWAVGGIWALIDHLWRQPTIKP
jgi:hypothetical protein